MRIRLAILESDTVYLNRIVSAFIIKYADKLEVYSFTDKDAAIQFLKSARIDVFLAGESFQVTEGEIPSACGFAYLVEEEDFGEDSRCDRCGHGWRGRV